MTRGSQWAVRLPTHRVALKATVLDIDEGRVCLRTLLDPRDGLGRWWRTDEIEWIDRLDGADETPVSMPAADTVPGTWKPVRPADPNEIEETERRLGERHNDKETA